ncbi:MAG TPA: response regulator [Bryobacteraceae bacterium]|jgi:two-component system cell cycle response regulator DivK|nr:response regulator [Bryobacteraceae bacterium]
MAVILVVEDDAANQELVTRFLKREGHTVFLAVDGKSGVSAAQQHVPDLIVMDLGLPGMDGWEAARQIRSSPTTSHIPIIALTAHALSADVKRASEVGFDGYETKPVVYQRLMKKIGMFVRL